MPFTFPRFGFGFQLFGLDFQAPDYGLPHQDFRAENRPYIILTIVASTPKMALFTSRQDSVDLFHLWWWTVLKIQAPVNNIIVQMRAFFAAHGS